MDTECRERFEEQYDRVFDSKGRTRACGRAECIKLMDICHDLTGRPVIDFGNPSVWDGRMNISAIQELYKELHS